MDIRLATEADIPAIQAIQNHYITTTYIHFAYEPVTDAEGLADWYAARDKHPWLVGVEDGAVLGFSRSAPWKTRAAYAWTVESAVYLRPELRGRGFGRALYDRLLAILRAQGYRTVLGGITLPNDASVKLHEAVGMRRCAALERAGFKLGKWWTVAYWRMDLADTESPPTPVRTVMDAMRALPTA